MSGLLMLLLVAAPVDLARDVRARLSRAEVQQGTFVQRKQVKGFKRALVSNGTFRVSKASGVQWETLAPFASQLTVKPEQIAATQNGAQAFRLDAKDEPSVRLITALLFGVLTGELTALQAHFTATGEVGASTWSVVLMPKTPQVKALFARIALSGDATVRAVTLVQANGDATELTLTPTAAP